MVGILKSNLKDYNPEAYQIFCDKMEEASGVTTQKRFYMSNMVMQMQEIYYLVKLIP